MPSSNYIPKRVGGGSMVVPTFEDMMEPVLRGISSGKDYSTDDLEEIVKVGLGLSEEDLSARTKDGRMTRVRYELTWTKSYLKKAGLVESPAYRMIRTTERGREVLESKPERIDRKLLKKLETNETKEDPRVLNPGDEIMKRHSEIEDLLKSELLEKVRTLHPRVFELVVLDLCKKMDSKADVEHTGKPGDGGVDGIVHVDKFGVSKIYVQAKRYTNPITKGQVMEFIAAVSGKSTKNGIFITTADIPQSARKEAETNQTVSIRLVDGNELAALMIEHNVGVATRKSLEIKEIETSYFEGFDLEPRDGP